MFYELTKILMFRNELLCVIYIMKNIRIRTTVCLEVECIVFLEEMSRKLKISRSAYLSMIAVSMLKKNIRSSLRLYRCVKYQSGNKKVNVMHFTPDGKTYEACTDLRKFCKVSVSLLLNTEIRCLMKVFADGNKTAASFFCQKISIEELDNYEIKYKIKTFFAKSCIERYICMKIAEKQRE